MDEHYGAGIFTEALFGNAPNDLWMLVWTTPDRKSHWIRTGRWDAVVEAANALSGNVYLGAGLLPKPLGEKRRGKAADIAGIPGVWADIDYGTDGHQKSGLPPDERAAWELIESLPLPPTLVVHSGYGLQAWWLLHEFWLFDDQAERDRAEATVRGWQAMIRAKGSTVDSTWDLARVMRLPSTFNVKRDPARPVQIAQHDATARYAIDELAAYCQDDPEPVEDTEKVELHELPADPPFDKFNNLYANDDEFRKVYDHKRRLEDDSLSGFDLALANIAVKAAWSDTEIVGLLVAHRRRYGGGGPKHRGYYEATLTKARAGLERLQAAVRLEEMQINGETPSREAVLRDVSAQLGVTVTGLIEYTGTEPTYRLLANGTSIMLGSAVTLAQQARFRTKMIAVGGFLPDPVKERVWVKLVNALLSIRERQSTGEENTETGIITDYLSSYLFHCRTPLEYAKVEEARKDKVPFLSKDGELCIYSTALRSFIFERAGERITRPELAAMLKAAGCKDRTIGFQKADGTWTTTAAWTIPDLLYREVGSEATKQASF